MNHLKRINSEDCISNLFKNLARKKSIPITVEVRNKQYIAHLMFTARKGSEPSIIIEEDEIRLETGEEIMVSLPDPELPVCFKTVAASTCAGSTINIEKPLGVYASFRRSVPRWKFCDDEEATICFEAGGDKRRLVDIGLKGLSFVSKDRFLETGMYAKNVLVSINEGFNQYISGKVRYVRQDTAGEYRYGLEFEEMNGQASESLFQWINTKIRPNIKSFTNTNRNEIERILEESKYMTGAHFQKNMEAIRFNLDEMRNNSLIFSGLSYNVGNQCVAFGTSRKIYERTFLGHEVFCAKEARFDSKPWTDIYAGLADNLLIRPDFENLILYISEGSKWQMETMADVEKIIGNQEKFFMDTVECYKCDTSRLLNNDNQSEYHCEALEGFEIFIDYCKSNLMPLVINSYGYCNDNFFPDSIKSLYESEGYSIDRRLLCVKKDKKIIAFAVAESSSDALGFDGLNDHCELYLVKGRADKKYVLETLLPAAASFFHEHRKESFRLLVNGTEHLAESYELSSGAAFECKLKRVIMNCRGLIEFRKLLAGNFIDFKKYYPLTYPQMSIWQTEKVFPGTSFGNIVVTPYLKGDMDFKLLEKAINLAVEKNDAYRIRIVEQGDTTKQYIAKYQYFEVDFFDFCNRGGQEAYQEWSQRKTNEPFNLIDSELFYFAVFKINENEHGVYIKVHHTIADAWATISQTSKIVEYYSRLKKDMEVSRINEPSYIDFIMSENEYLSSDRYENNKRFWNEKFNTVPEFLSLKPSGTVYRNIKAARKTFVLTKELTSRIHHFCEENKCSPFVVFLSALYTYISRITSKSDIVLGTPVLNRSNAREKNMVGMFISIIPMRFNVDDKQDFISFVNSLSKEWTILLKNQKYPYSLLQKEFREKHKVNDSLFDVVLSYQNVKLEMTELTGDYKLEWHSNGNQTDSLQIHINDREGTGGYVLDFDYLVDLFCEEEIERMGNHFINLLSDAMHHPASALGNLNILSENERKQILDEFNNTGADYPKDKTLHELIEAQVKRRFDNTAVEFNESKLTYKELDDRANSLAVVLRKRGVQPNSIVAIMTDRSLELIVGILGILKAGGAYLPINPNYPTERINYILKDSGARILLVKDMNKHDIMFEGSILRLQDQISNIHRSESLENINQSTDLAYVIYTSGSTGQPKGVMIEHRSLINFLYSMYNIYDGSFSMQDRCLSLTNISFDVSVCEIFISLVFGACLVLYDDSDYLDITKLSNIIMDKSISFAYIPPSLLKDLARLLKRSSGRLKLDKLLVGVEPIKASVIDDYVALNPKMKIINGYGPTETTICSTFYCYIPNEDKNSNIPIGKPLQNTKVYILDKNMLPVSVDVVGELYISGDGLARGYLNRLELTEEKFVKNPFLQGRMYKTGDLAKWRHDGNIQFIGREDNQVKLRGFRIELGEIENQLSNISDIYKAVVIMRADKQGNKYLCAYFTSSRKLNIQEIKAHLLKAIPEYMIPRYFVRIDEMPLTYNGKVDKKLLPEPDIKNEENYDFTPPSNEVEKKLAQAWQEVLNINRIGVKNNFFEYGADSLTIMRVLVEVLEYGWNVTMQDFYEHQTIRELSNKIAGKYMADAYDEIAAASSPITLTSKMESAPAGGKREVKNALLTGSTGFLGAHILESLIENTGANVFCLVRGENNDISLKRLLEKLEFYFGKKMQGLINERIFVLSGDITCERLGLSLQQYAALSQQIDTVIHTAALVKHFGDYSLFGKMNVLGTQRIIDFCVSSGAKLNHVSTISISGDSFEQKESNLRFTENDLYIGQNMGGNVYLKSKFEAEKLIFETAKESLNASIFRVGNITGRYCDGHFQYNITENRFYNILKFFIQLGVVSSDIYEWEVEFTPVDFCSKAILRLSELNNSSLNVYHLFNHNKVALKEIIQALRPLGCSIQLVDDKQYNMEIERISRSNDRKETVVKVINELSGEGVFSPTPSVHTSSETTKQYLKALDIEWPSVDAEYLRKIYLHMKKVGFIS